jgi:hypothetical protein
VRPETGKRPQERVMNKASYVDHEPERIMPIS